jgi:hypothetical protein
MPTLRSSPCLALCPRTSCCSTNWANAHRARKFAFLAGIVAGCQILSSDLIRDSVDQYVVQAATLRLKHNCPTSSPPVVANVNVEHVLERVKRHELDVGTWINVIGYVEQRKEKGVFVQAVAVWDAGDVDLEAYERAVECRKQAT